jgi:hypothetical protein
VPRALRHTRRGCAAIRGRRRKLLSMLEGALGCCCKKPWGGSIRWCSTQAGRALVRAGLSRRQYSQSEVRRHENR